MAEQQQDVDTLKRRGRRRLVGAVALVLLAVIVLPMVFDPAPRQAAPPVSVRLPGENDAPFNPKPVPKAAAPTPKAPQAEEMKAEDKKAEEKKAEEKKPVEKKVVEKNAEEKGVNAELVIPVGAFAHPEPVMAKLAEAKVRYYTEKVSTSSGTVTRVRAGPFATRAQAEKALETLKGLGLKPGNIGPKS
jgi:DedD protein